MKNFYILVAVLSITMSANAQKKHVLSSTQISNVGIPMINTERAINDTLVGPSWLNPSAIPTLYEAANGGYLAGNNGYQDKAKAQSFINTSGTVSVEGALIWFGAKQSASGSQTSKVTVKEYSLNGTGELTSGTVNIAPGTENKSTDLKVVDIDTGSTFALGTNIIMFPTPQNEAANFAIGVDFTTLTFGDFVGIVSSTDGNAGETELAWEKWSDNSWNGIYSIWNMDIDLFIWALVDNSSGTGIEEGFLNGARLSQNMPNPATNSTIITYELQNENQNVSINLFDATGKLIQTINEGNKAAGKYTVKLETTNLESGIYYYALSAGKGRIAKKMTIVR